MKKLILFFVMLLSFASVALGQQYLTDIVVTSGSAVWTDSRAFDTLQDAITDIGASQQTLYIPVLENFAGTIPSNIRLKFFKDGGINATGAVTINTKKIEAPNKRIFFGAGAFNFISGCELNSVWFEDLDEAIAETSNDEVTMVMTALDTVTGSVAIGNNVTLKWDAPGNEMVLPVGVIVSNIDQVEAGDFPIVLGVGRLDFNDGAVVKSTWFNRLRTAARHIDDSEVVLEIRKSETLNYSYTMQQGTTLSYKRGSVITMNAGKTLTLYSPENIDAGIRQTIKAGAGDLRFSEGGTVHAGWAGAVADGVTDDTAEIQDAADWLTDNVGTVKLASGTYVVSTDIVLPRSINLEGAGIDKTTISGTTITNLAYALIYNTGATLTTIEEDVADTFSAGEVTITFGAAPGLVAGDLIILRNDADFSWNPSRAYYRQGEFFVVKSVAGAVATLCSSAIDSYTIGNFDVYKVNPTTTCLRDFTIDGYAAAATGNDPTIWLTWARDSQIERVRIRNSNSTGIYIRSGYNCKVSNVEVGKYVTDAGAVQSTGVLVNGQYIVVEDSVLNSDRHGASTGGSIGGIEGTDPAPNSYGVDRFIVFRNNLITSTTNYAADFHGNAEFCSYINNHIVGGINYSGSNNQLIENQVYTGTLNTLVNFEALVSVSCVIEGNEFNQTGSGYVLDANSVDDINANTTVDGTFIFRNNKIIRTYAGDGTCLYIRNNGSTAENRFHFIGNEVVGDGTNFSDFLSTSVVTGNPFTEIKMVSNRLTNAGLGNSVRAIDLNIVSNIMDDSGNVNNAGTFYSTGGKISILNNFFNGFIDNVQTTYVTTEPTYVEVKGNYFAGNPAGNIQAEIFYGDETVVIGNTFGNTADASQTNPVSYSSQDEFYEADNHYIGLGSPTHVGNITVTNAWTFTIGDDAVNSFTPFFPTGIIKVVSDSSTAFSGVALFRAEAGGASSVLVGNGADFEVATGALVGNTGNDNKITVSPHTDGKIYIENRSGGALDITFRITESL